MSMNHIKKLPYLVFTISNRVQPVTFGKYIVEETNRGCSIGPVAYKAVAKKKAQPFRPYFLLLSVRGGSGTSEASFGSVTVFH